MRRLLITAALVLPACGSEPPPVWPGECDLSGSQPPGPGSYDIGEAVPEDGGQAATEALAGVDWAKVYEFEQIDLYSGEWTVPIGRYEILESCYRTFDGQVIRLGDDTYADKVWLCRTSCGLQIGLRIGDSLASAELIPGEE